MHVTPQRVDVAPNDKYGIINIAPAGDKEADVTGVQWTQRTNVMRASIIYLRNNPSILFWEAGNNGISAAHMKEMQDLRKQWDPSGGRAMGCRDLDDAGAAPYAEYFGTMVAYDPSWTPTNDAAYRRGYSNNYRNQAPIIEAEDERDEGARRYWDDYSPPHVGGFKPGPDDTYHWTSESIITGDSSTKAAIWRLDIWKNVYSIQNRDSAHSRYAGYASIYFSDSNADGRQMSSEVARASGKVDAVRLPKQLYFAHRVVGNPQPDIHVIGHWTYPAGTRKTMYVVANTPQVELFVNGASIGKSAAPTDHYLFSFPNVAWASGTVRAVGYDASGKQVASHELKTAGAPASVKLTATAGPNGLQADGADVVMIDFEVVDAAGQRVPDRRGARRFFDDRPRRLARRLQQRRPRLDEQHVSTDGGGHQPCLRTVHPDAGNHHGHGYAREPCLSQRVRDLERRARRRRLTVIGFVVDRLLGLDATAASAAALQRRSMKAPQRAATTDRIERLSLLLETRRSDKASYNRREGHGIGRLLDDRLYGQAKIFDVQPPRQQEHRTGRPGPVGCAEPAEKTGPSNSG